MPHYARVKEQTLHRWRYAVSKTAIPQVVSPLSSFGVLDGLDAGVKAVYLDRGFYYDSLTSHAASGAQLRVRDPDHPVGWRGFSKSSRKDGVASFSMI